MSREILFRCKAKIITPTYEPIGTWVYGYYNEIKDMSVIQTKQYYCQVEKDTVGQFTGLTDKNGKKIFEGDIVKFKDYDKLPFVGEVKYIKEVAGFVVYVVCKNVYSSTILWAFVDINLEQTEVIGNIHDNPELLQEK